MLSNNTRPIIVALCDLERELAPLRERFEEEKEAIRGVGKGVYEIEGVGKVTVNAASVAKCTGSELKLDPEAYASAPASLKAKLVKLGIVVDTPTYSQNRKASVKVELA